MVDFTAERQAAFVRLGAVVERLIAEGKSTRSAGIKPVMQFSDIGFDEKRLGFRTFRAFLEDAERAGYIRLRRASEGPDVDVLPVTAAAEAGGEHAAQRIRGDLWSAFVDWRADWSRVYDRETDSVGWLPSIEAADESGLTAELRRAVHEHSERYVAIEPLDQQTTLAWMSEFVDGLEEGTAKLVLKSALASPRPIRAFVSAAHEAGTHEGWSRARLERVRERIGEWSATNGVDVDLTRERESIGRPRPFRREASPQRPLRGVTPAGSTPALNDLRERVCRAVRRMSRGELLRLAIPLEYVLDEDSR